MAEELDFYSLTVDEIRNVNKEIMRMRYEMLEAQKDGKYYFWDLDVNSLPYEELKEEYENMKASIR